MQVPDQNSVVVVSNQLQYNGQRGNKGSPRRNSMSRNQIAAFLQKRIKKTRICSHYLNGRCAHGADCSFAHSADELRELPDLYKTRLCVEFSKSPNGCLRGDACRYAHGMEELRSTEEVYKTALCITWNTTGTCPSGDRCRWAHGTEELRQIAAPEFPMNYHYDFNQYKKRASASLPNSRGKERMQGATSMPDPSFQNCIDSNSAAAPFDPNMFSSAYIGNVPLLQNNHFSFLHQNFDLAGPQGPGVQTAYDPATLCYDASAVPDYQRHPAVITPTTYSAAVPGYYPVIPQQTTQQPVQKKILQQQAAMCNYSIPNMLPSQGEV